MEAAAGAAQLLIGKVLTKLSDDLVGAFVASAFVASPELGLNSHGIKLNLQFTQFQLSEAQRKGIGEAPGLRGLLVQLSSKASEAEDALNELHYFMIQDQLDGTHDADPADLGSAHGGQSARHNIGNCLPFFSCSCMDQDNPQKETKSDSGGQVDKLTFDRVAMSNKIKSVLAAMHCRSLCVSELLRISSICGTMTGASATRRLHHSPSIQDTLYGRRAIFEKTVDVITSCDETLSVLPVVGPGGIGKTALLQHLYNDARIEQHFTAKFWICVSTDFDVLKLTQILACMPATENEGSSSATNETNSLDQLQRSIAQRIKSKRFLIVFDDIWECNTEGWKILLAPFMKGEAKGSMVLATTRFPGLAEIIGTVDPIELQGLESNDFFTFFEACIFGGLNKHELYGDELSVIAREIASKLKGAPLAAKSAGRLLKKDLSREHWMGVLENRAWEKMTNDDDIMPALHLSYDYLPFFLQKCFSYFSLFPEHYMFSNSEMNRFWIALGIIDSSERGSNSYLNDLVSHGFLQKRNDLFGQKYVMHGFLHELARSVSAQECLNISSLNFKADTVPKSVRHLSITLEDTYAEKFREEMCKLKSRIDIADLRSLMIFSEYQERIAEILNDTFKEVNSLHVLFIVVKSLDDLPQNFSKLIHLQYLKFGSPRGKEMTLPSTLSRFYHLKFLDLENWHGSPNFPKDITRLVNLRYLLAKKELHSNVPEVGKMMCLQELQEFCVKKESVGFELTELGALTELGGELRICNLEKVATKEEASDAKLVLKRELEKLSLVWGREQPITIDANVLDGLQPHPNLRELAIINHGGSFGPSWLCADILLKHLEALDLEGVSWDTLPPFGQLRHLTKLILKNISGVHQLGIEDMASLESLIICRCGKLFSGCLLGEVREAQTIKPFPASLKKLGISSDSSIQSMALLSNLTSLTHLTLQDCVSLTVDGFNPLITVNLKVLVVFNCRWDRSCPDSVAADLLSEVARSEIMPVGSFQLEQLKVDSISAVLVTPICNLFANCLHTLIFCHDQRVKSFTEEQEKALKLLNSLQHLRFECCGALQSLPRGLRRLSSLEQLEILWCPEIRLIHKEGFPVSLRNLRIRPCSGEVKEQIEQFKRINPDLSVWYE